MIYVIGDLHGDGRFLEHILLPQIEKLTESDIIITLGDVGIKYGGKNSGLKNFLLKFPCTWLIMRGNHDDRYWKDVVTKEVIDGETRWIAAEGWSFSNYFDEITLVEDKYPNIHYIDDAGGFYNIENYNCLFLPGAYSVDKDWRLTTGRAYCFEEQLTYGEMNKFLKDNSKVDFIFSHTCPISLTPYLEDLFLSIIDQNTVDKTTEHFLERVRELYDFKHWFFGHYHGDRLIENKFTMLYRTVARLEDYV